MQIAIFVQKFAFSSKYDKKVKLGCQQARPGMSRPSWFDTYGSNLSMGQIYGPGFQAQSRPLKEMLNRGPIHGPRVQTSVTIIVIISHKSFYIVNNKV